MFKFSFKKAPPKHTIGASLSVKIQDIKKYNAYKFEYISHGKKPPSLQAFLDMYIKYEETKSKNYIEVKCYQISQEDKVMGTISGVDLTDPDLLKVCSLPSRTTYKNCIVTPAFFEEALSNGSKFINCTQPISYQDGAPLDDSLNFTNDDIVTSSVFLIGIQAVQQDDESWLD